MKSSIPKTPVIVTSLLFLVVTACAGQIESKTIPTPSPPEPTPSPRALVLPDDDASHQSPIEWWYYNGHLQSDDGDKYSFHFVIFQTQRADEHETFEIGQAGITDVASANHHVISSQGFAALGSEENAKTEILLRLNLGNFGLDIESDGSHQFEARDLQSGTGIKLRTRAPESTMLHEGVGWMDWPFGWTYYYTYPRMTAEGTLTIDNREIEVSGEVWFDHQWGDFFVVGKPAGWQWFALHLDDGRSLMIAEVRGADGEVVATDGTLIEPGSPQKVLDAESDGLQLDVLEHWTSPHTDGEYPSSWRLRVESVGIDVQLAPTIADQEIPAMPYGNQAAAYWEGRVDVFDTATGRNIGTAFAELSGYVDPDPLTWRKITP